MLCLTDTSLYIYIRTTALFLLQCSCCGAEPRKALRLTQSHPLALFACPHYQVHSLLPTAHAPTFPDTPHFLMAHAQVSTTMATCSVTGSNTSLQMAPQSRIISQLLQQPTNNRQQHRSVSVQNLSITNIRFLRSVHCWVTSSFPECTAICNMNQQSVMTQTHSSNEQEYKTEFSNTTK